jgi:hypothetical protein
MPVTLPLTPESLPTGTINIVGNAASMLQKQNGSLIDRYPTVRFNRVEIVNPLAQGNRWDILASAEVNTFMTYNNEEPRFHSLIFTPSVEDSVYKSKKIKFNTTIYNYPKNLANDLTRLLESKPSTGIMILHYLNTINHKKVNVFGFDWKDTPTMYETRNKGNHNFKKEKALVLEMIEQNGWNLY